VQTYELAEHIIPPPSPALETETVVHRPATAKEFPGRERERERERERGLAERRGTERASSVCVRSSFLFFLFAFETAKL